MGNARWEPKDWDRYKTKNVAGKTQAQVFTSTGMKDEFNPAKIKVRESCDSDNNPKATPIILASDVTGSMGQTAHTLMKDGLNTLITQIYDRKPVSDPHVMVMAVGDLKTDSAPLQVTQFEADISLAEQLQEIYIEGYGGGNDGESYSSAHLFAGMKTDIDVAKKRGAKGFLFTIGDEPNHDVITKAHAARIGIDLEEDVTAEQALALAQRNWEVFHIALVNEGYCQHSRREVLKRWNKLMPERVIPLENVDDIAETIVSVIQVHNGADRDAVAKSWSGDTSLVVQSALASLPAVQGGSGGLERLG